MKNILIIRLSSLGDIIHALPAFASLRKGYPNARITWVVEESGKEILDLVSGIDRIIVARTKGWNPLSGGFWRGLSQLRRELKQNDLVAIDFQGLLKSGFLCRLSGAKRRIGFHRNNLREPAASYFYTEHLEPVSEKGHVIKKNLELLRLVNIVEDSYSFPLSIPGDLTESMNTKLKDIGFRTGQRLIVLNVGAAWETKRWFPERWIELIGKIKKPDLFPLILWGSDIEKHIADQVNRETGIPIVPPMTIKEVFALLQKTSILVTGDTFALQAACALDRPVVALFAPTNPDRNGPFNPLDKITFHKTECSHCYKRQCPNPVCLESITPEEVAGLVDNILDNDERLRT
ncbi:glycosyltransferase family 9 protein [Acidobacteriota bacterium]